jgi:hypothetical protein
MLKLNGQLITIKINNINMKKIRKIIFKLLTGVDIDSLRNKNNNTLDSGLIQLNSEFNEIYLFDFKNYQSQYNDNASFISNGGIISHGVFIGGEETPSKIKVKPIDVLNELEIIPNPLTLTLLDEKIEILKEKSKLIVQSYVKREINALIERIENRKKYLEFKIFFDSFQNTNDEKIDILLNKYDLVMKTSDIFVPEFPDQAIIIMKEYSDKMMELCNKKPIFYVIATEDNFQEKYKQRDPILLVQSPFGFYWQILGAWDKEMLLLSEL